MLFTFQLLYLKRLLSQTENSGRLEFEITRVYSIFSVNHISVFVCVGVLRPSQLNGVMSSAVSLPNHTFTGQALSSKWLTSIVHILSPETDNCPSFSHVQSLPREREKEKKNETDENLF